MRCAYYRGVYLPLAPPDHLWLAGEHVLVPDHLLPYLMCAFSHACERSCLNARLLRVYVPSYTKSKGVCALLLYIYLRLALRAKSVDALDLNYLSTLPIRN